MKTKVIVFTLFIFFFNAHNTLADNYCGDGIVNSWPDPDAETKITKWSGAGLASNSSNWTNGAPEKGDTVVFANNSISDCDWDLDLGISTLTMKANYIGTINLVDDLIIDVEAFYIKEECDDGNTDEKDGCLSNCTVEYVGDGTTQIYLGEECDLYECNSDGKRVLDCSEGAGIAFDHCSVVYKAGDVPCTETYGPFGYYYTDYNGEGLDTAIHQTSYGNRKRVVVCPGEYKGNYAWYRGYNSQLVAWSSPTLNINQPYETITAANFSNNIDYMNDTVLRSKNGNTTLYISTGSYANGVSPLYGRVSGFRITGATNATCPVWINNEQGYETGEPCAGIRYYCTESHQLDHMLFEGNNVGWFVKDTDPEWDFDIQAIRIVSIRNNIGVKWKYGNGNTLKFSDIIGNYITGIDITDAKDHLVKLNYIKDNPYAIMLKSERYSIWAANDGVLIKKNNIYNGILYDSCPDKNYCPRFYYNWINNGSSQLNWYPSSEPYNILEDKYSPFIDSC